MLILWSVLIFVGRLSDDHLHRADESVPPGWRAPRVVASMISLQQSELEHFAFLHGLEADKRRFVCRDC